MQKSIRVVQYGVGWIGAAIVRLMLEKNGLEIVGAVDADPSKVGKDLGQVAGAGRDLGVRISRDLASAAPSGTDVIVHSTTSSLKRVSGELMECARAGAHVVSTCEELSYPFRKYPELSRQLDQVARENKVAMVGVGVNPGFAMDKLVLTLATACHRADRVEVHRVVDASRRRLPLQRKVGAGITVEEFNAKVKTGVIKHHGLPESLAMIADALGVSVDAIEETIEPVVAEKAAHFESIEVPAGHVLGVHQVARGLRGGEAPIRLELHMYMGAPDPVDAVTIHGQPDLKLQVPGGIHGDLATTAVAVNCIPAALEVQPGLRTARDIPMCYFPGLQASGKAQGTHSGR